MKHGCAWYMNIIGANPQTGESMNRFDCAIVLMPVLMIESTQAMRGNQAAIESFRNEMSKQNDKLLAGVDLNGRFPGPIGQ